MKRTPALAVSATILTTVLASLAAGTAQAAVGATDDTYRVSSRGTTRINAARGVLSNDHPATAQIVDATSTSQGTLDLANDGSFTYVPNGGASGQDSFTYTTNQAVRLFTEDIKPLATINGVTIGGSAFGSAWTAKPGSSTVFYGLTDRGPNVDGPDDTKIEAIPSFTPSIGEFVLKNGKAQLRRVIRLRAADGTLMNGLVNTEASTGETITDLDGNVLSSSPYGLDSEGLVAMPDGTFWVSDEYGPFVVHFDRNGREIERLSPQSGTLPTELASRTVNRGMEGLTITPDGTTLVGIMQSALTQPDASKPKSNPLTRIVTINLRTKAVHEYPYLLDDPAVHGTAVSEITAVSNRRFIVIERDGNAEPNAYKKLYTVDLRGATDIGPSSNVSGAEYDASLGLTVDGASLESLTSKKTTPEADTLLTAVGISPVTKSLTLDLGAYLTDLNPDGSFYGHDKIEGLAVVNHGRTLVLSNDSDFGIDGVTGDTAPFTLAEKLLPNGTQDDGEILTIDLRKIDKPSTSATVTLHLR